MNASNLDKIFKDCLFKEDELIDGKPPGDFVKVHGIMQNFGFHPERLKSHSDEIVSMFDDLHPNFTIGGGWTFLNLCADKDGNQWGEHRNCEQLVALAIGLNRGAYCLPRDTWDALPGGVPFVRFSKDEMNRPHSHLREIGL